MLINIVYNMLYIHIYDFNIGPKSYNHDYDFGPC